ncbi:hypothetical protein DL89DRAFT_107131 [Linderina pennispora]|uniref:Uncharacterized protein n=1 Tax=Linderina pennispora TaxID=61395 RepID=A0A1Y1WEV2_9FUNG|nr:uncharacterized protein DL89DRAFT_107131 [Linderina pennispora]ORX72059.1 hypothetical protein DL89DRAFT_107131 [Linderina pennispora]
MDIVKCFADSITEFVSVETEQEAVMREAASEKPFFVFEKDYFTAYNSPEGTVKCSYWSRNRITQDILYPQSLSWQKLLCEQDGLKVYPEPPGLCFLPSDGTCDASLTLRSNNISVYYNDIDIEQFVQTVKKMAACQQGFFFVAHNDKFECVEAGEYKQQGGC